MRTGYKIGVVPADTDEQVSKPARLCDDSSGQVWSRIEVYAPEGGHGVTGNTDAVWIGDEYVSAVADHEAGVPLHPGDSYEFSGMRLCDIWMAVTTDGDKVTWIAYA